MVFKNNFVAVVKYNGKILREQGEYVTLPFGSEYSILLKNLEARKAVVSINIDGKDVLSGRRLIVQSNSELELKGLKKDGLVRNKFKFIQKTQEISDHLGDKVDDGIIRVEVTYEQQVFEFINKGITDHKTVYRSNWPYIWYNDGPFTYDWPSEVRYVKSNQDRFRSTGVEDHNVFETFGYGGDSSKPTNAGYTLTNSGDSVNCFMSSREAVIPKVTPKHDEGITVKGSEVNQKFIPAATKTLESSSHVIVIRLRGVTDIGVVVKKAVTVKTKLTCETCGKKNKSNMKYCPNCGTYL